jgi:hypothetical protein
MGLKFDASGRYITSLERLRTQRSEEQEKIEKVAHEIWDFFNTIGLQGRDNPFPEIRLEPEWSVGRGLYQRRTNTVHVSKNPEPEDHVLLHELLHARDYDHGWVYQGQRFMSRTYHDFASPYILNHFYHWRDGSLLGDEDL